jgi:hypothetical protein
VEISVGTTTGQRVLLGQLGSGDFFGELSLLDGRERTADAVATEPTRAVEIDRLALEGLFKQHPGAALDVLTVIGKRLRGRPAPPVTVQRLAQPGGGAAPDTGAAGGRTAGRVQREHPFLVLHGLLFLVWIVWNLKLLPACPRSTRFPSGSSPWRCRWRASFSAASCSSPRTGRPRATGSAATSSTQPTSGRAQVTQLHTKLDTLYLETMARLATLERGLAPRP